MIGLIYVCNGKIKGFTFPISLVAMEEKDQRTFVRNMIEEGAKERDNVTPQDGTYKSWSCIVFDELGRPLWHYNYQTMEGKLLKVHVEQTEGAE